ncbi:MAG: phytanoyl-CoA dioxygenase family protein, partial [Myxococcota bacterium]
LHRSLKNQTPSGFRRALAFHACRAESLVPWMGAERRGPIGGADCRDFEMVAGEDPYPWAPREDVCRPWMRPARLM